MPTNSQDTFVICLYIKVRVTQRRFTSEFIELTNGLTKILGSILRLTIYKNMVLNLKSVLTLTFSSRKELFECLVNVFNQNGKFSADSSQEYC